MSELVMTKCAKCGRDVDHYIHGFHKNDIKRARACLLVNHDFVESLPVVVTPRNVNFAIEVASIDLELATGHERALFRDAIEQALIRAKSGAASSQGTGQPT